MKEITGWILLSDVEDKSDKQETGGFPFFPTLLQAENYYKDAMGPTDVIFPVTIIDTVELQNLKDENESLSYRLREIVKQDRRADK